jgi:glutamine cyclotransferase
VYRLPEMSAIGGFQYAGPGWGLAADGAGYVMSDGTDVLVLRDAAFVPTGTLRVTLAGRPLRGLNDLECANGRIYANVLMHTDIYEISPGTGTVERIVDCADVLMRSGRREFRHVLNGIAHCPERGTFWVTGKHWPTLFELQW